MGCPRGPNVGFVGANGRRPALVRRSNSTLSHSGADSRESPLASQKTCRRDSAGLNILSESGAVIADNRTAYYEGWVSVRLSFDGTDIPPDSHSRRIVWFRLQHGSDLSLGFCRLSDELAQCRCRVSQKACAERSFAVDKAANGPLVDAETSRESGGATE